MALTNPHLQFFFSSENDSTGYYDSDDSEIGLERRPKKRQKLSIQSTNAYKLSNEEASKYMRYKLSNFKIVECDECHHYARHPDAPDSLDIELVPKDVSVCLKKQDGCKHKCTHMSKKLANLQIISCLELRHIHSQKALNMEEVKDDNAILNCLLKNCSSSKSCANMVSAEDIKRLVTNFIYYYISQHILFSIYIRACQTKIKSLRFCYLIDQNISIPY